MAASIKVTEALNLIKQNQKVVDVYVPSLKRLVKFKHLTAGQQERFVQSLIDNAVVQSHFTSALIEVIKENCTEKSVINGLTVIDKHAIGLALRVASLGNILKTEIDNEAGIVYLIDLNENLNHVKELNNEALESIIIDNITIDLQYPTINQEQNNNTFFKKDSNTSDGSTDSIRSVLSNAFIGDILMFIKTLTILKDDGESLVVEFSQIALQDKLEIIRKLPNDIFEKILNPMSTVKNQIENILRAEGVTSHDSKLKRNILVTFDASLFIAAS